MQSWIARLSAALAGLALAGVVLGPLGARVGLLPPLGGFALFALSLLFGGGIAFASGLLGLWRTRPRTGLAGRRQAWVGTALGGLLLLSGFAMASGSAGVPPIHDLTTSPDRPPTFVELARHPDNQGRDLTYPHGGPEVTAQQREAYPDLAPIELAMPTEQAWSSVVSTARDMGWEIVSEDVAAKRLEASDRTRVFRFVDDVVVEVEPASSGNGSLVHVRSTSRVGQSDLGANAARIERFAAALSPAG